MSKERFSRKHGRMRRNIQLKILTGTQKIFIKVSKYELLNNNISTSAIWQKYANHNDIAFA